MKRLIMRYLTQDGKRRSYSIRHPRPDLTGEEVQTVMEAMKGVITPSDWIVDEAVIVDTQTDELFDLLE